MPKGGGGKTIATGVNATPHHPPPNETLITLTYEVIILY